MRRKIRQPPELVFEAHVYSEPFRCLSLLPRLLNPVRQLLRDDVYLHQSRLNSKQGFCGDAAWDWHQDFPPWHYIDGMREPRCIMAAVFIDDCAGVKSPLLVLPGTHYDGLLNSKRHKDAKGYALHYVDHATLERLAEEKGIEALIGPAGSVCFIHCNILQWFGQQCLPLAAGDHVFELQRGQQRLHRHESRLAS